MSPGELVLLWDPVKGLPGGGGRASVGARVLGRRRFLSIAREMLVSPWAGSLSIANPDSRHTSRVELPPDPESGGQHGLEAAGVKGIWCF